MTNNQRHRCRSATFLVNKVQVDTIDRCNKVGKAIDGGFLYTPVEFIQPVSAQFFHILKVRTISPTPIIGHLMPSVTCDLATDKLKRFDGYFNLKRTNHRGISRNI